MTTQTERCRTSDGWLEGRRDGRARAFLGVPYAAPPVGPARFDEPRPPARWTGTRDAGRFGPAAPQIRVPILPVLDDGREGDDWLTLNVWTPVDHAPEPRPVLVWVHGGGFLMGTSAEPDYNGRRLAAEHGVVVVTVNYRVGVEGFAQLEGAPPNRGLLDVVAALRWVRQEIEAFGGDPERVTLAGQSAGAAVVVALAAMPRARGLFHRLVAQSPPGTVLDAAIAADVAERVLGRLCHRPRAAELAEVDPRTLASTFAPALDETRRQVDRWGAFAHAGMPFAPVVDGDVLPETGWQASARGALRNIPLLVGYAQDESRLFLTLAGALEHEMSEAQADGVLEGLAGDVGGAAAYRAAFPEATNRDLVEIAQSDVGFRMPALHLAQAQVQGRGAAWVYQVSWSAPTTVLDLGACHCLDYGLLFGVPSVGLTGLLTRAATPAGLAEFESMSRTVRTAWTTFFTHGRADWTPYDESTRAVQVLDLPGRVEPCPVEVSRRLWSSVPPSALTL